MQIGAFPSDMFGEGSIKFGEAPVETKRPNKPPFTGGGAEADSGAPSGGGGAKVGDKYTILESDYDPGIDVDTVVNTGDTPPPTPPDEEEEEPKFKINPLILIGAGIAAFLFFKKRK